MMRKKHVGPAFTSRENVIRGRIECNADTCDVGSRISDGEADVVPSLGIRCREPLLQSDQKIIDCHSDPLKQSQERVGKAIEVACVDAIVE